jgi:predicted RNA binding protein YcfA (HicA-like mRNA interferase family)
MNSKELIKWLEAEGWVLRGVKGSHHVFTHPSIPVHISILHPKKDIGVGLLNKIRKQAGQKQENIS